MNLLRKVGFAIYSVVVLTILILVLIYSGVVIFVKERFGKYEKKS